MHRPNGRKMEFILFENAPTPSPRLFNNRRSKSDGFARSRFFSPFPVHRSPLAHSQCESHTSAHAPANASTAKWICDVIRYYVRNNNINGFAFRVIMYQYWFSLGFFSHSFVSVAHCFFRACNFRKETEGCFYLNCIRFAFIFEYFVSLISFSFLFFFARLFCLFFRTSDPLVLEMFLLFHCWKDLCSTE